VSPTSSQGVADLVRRARSGETRALARLISLVESGPPAVREVSAALAAHVGRAHVVGVTGAPGVGKSTMISALASRWRAGGRTVGVLAVDPSSPFSGGALLGDRIRMTEHAADPGVYVRSMAGRGRLGGLSDATPSAVRVLDAAGYDIVAVETVGAGQSELDVAALADITVVMVAPGTGDGIQAAKAGILEIGDVLCVNKADLDGAVAVRRELRSVLSAAQADRQIVFTAALAGDGVDDLVRSVDEQLERLRSSGRLHERRRTRIRWEIERIAIAELNRRLACDDRLDALAERVSEGSVDAFAAADELVSPRACDDQARGSGTTGTC